MNKSYHHYLEVVSIKTKTSKILGICLVLGLLAAVVPVYASGLLATPPQFKFKLNSTSPTGSGELTVKNIGSDTVNVNVDKKRMLKDDVHLELTDGGVSNWINITSPTNFTLAPGQSATVSFKITAPGQFNYNDAVGALVINGTPRDTGNHTGITVVQGIQLVVPVVVGLPGPIIQSLQVTGHSAPQILLDFVPGVFTYKLNNNGTVYANVTGNITMHGLLNSPSVPIQAGVYPGDSYTLKANWTPGFFDMGPYSADTNLNYGRYQQNNTVTTHDSVFVIPVWLIVIIAVVLLVWYLRRKGVKSPIKIKIERK